MKASLLLWKATAKNSAVSSALPSTVDAAGASHQGRRRRSRANTAMSSSWPAT